MKETEKMKYLTAIVIALMLSVSAYGADPSPTPAPTGDEQLKTALAEFVHSTTSTLNSAKAFTAEQAPEIFQQYLVWSVFGDTVWASVTGAIALLLLGLGLFCLIGEIAWRLEDTAGFGVFFVIIGIAFAVLAGGFIMDIQKIKMAPKVYLLEYAKGLVK